MTHTSRMKWAMIHSISYLLPIPDKVFGFIREERVLEMLPNKIDSLLVGVQHVARVEAIVAEFIHHDLVGWKIMNAPGIGLRHEFSDDPKLTFAE